MDWRSILRDKFEANEVSCQWKQNTIQIKKNGTLLVEYQSNMFQIGEAKSEYINV